MYKDRIALYQQIEQARKSRLLVCVTGDRPQLETHINHDFVNLFTRHLDLIGDVERISLFLYTQGGDPLSAWSLVNLLRQYGRKLEIIVPAKAHSAGTLLCVGADEVLMTRQATLGVTDTAINHPLSPGIPGAPPHIRFPVGVESVYGFLELSREFLSESADRAQAFGMLARSVHPLVLGQAFRAHTHVRILMRKLLSRRMTDEKKIEDAVEYLCGQSSIHTFTIDRTEAAGQLGLPVTEPDPKLYELIKRVFDGIGFDMELGTPFNPFIMLGADSTCDYSFQRALVESVEGGSDAFVSEGKLGRQQMPSPPGAPPQMGFADMRAFEGWRHRSN